MKNLETERAKMYELKKDEVEMLMQKTLALTKQYLLAASLVDREKLYHLKKVIELHQQASVLYYSESNEPELQWQFDILIRILSSAKALEDTCFLEEIKNLMANSLEISDEEAIAVGKTGLIRGKSFFCDEEFKRFGKDAMIEKYIEKLKDKCENNNALLSEKKESTCIIQ